MEKKGNKACPEEKGHREEKENRAAKETPERVKVPARAGLPVRPHVLVRLLDYLIGQNHPVFHGKGSAEELREEMRKVIDVEYPETEPEKPEDEREGHVPASILSLLEEPERREDEEGDAERKPQKRLRISNDKNATPGDGARSLDKCLDDIRPHAMCIDRSAKSASDPATQSEGALQSFGELQLQTGNKMINQFKS